MAIYTVHVPSDGEDALARAEGTTFVPDGFSWSAFLYGPLYLIRIRAWLFALLWVVVVLALAVLCRAVRMPFGIEVALGVLIALFTGLEAGSIRRLTLHRRGLDLVEVVEGATREDGERRYFRSAVLDGLPPRRTVAGPGQATANGPVIGFSDSGLWP